MKNQIKLVQEIDNFLENPKYANTYIKDLMLRCRRELACNIALEQLALELNKEINDKSKNSCGNSTFY
jgi:hypothetical protein